jgi:rhamnosyl/mannosyltransferase
MVVTYHCDVRRRGWHRAYEAVVQLHLRRAGLILVTSPQSLESSPTLRPHRGRCVVQPVGTDHRRLAETARAREVARALRAAHPGPLALFVGRLRTYKGLHVLLDALPQVPGTLVLVGRGEEEEALRARVGREGLRDRVVFAGDVAEEDLAGYYRGADLFVLPSVSRGEFFGQAMLEAMACGLPAVSTRLGTGTSYLNRDGETGLEVPPGDAAALAEGMRRLLENPGEARRMGERARARAATLDSGRMVRHTLEVYSDLLAGRAPRPHS